MAACSGTSDPGVGHDPANPGVGGGSSDGSGGGSASGSSGGGKSSDNSGSGTTSGGSTGSGSTGSSSGSTGAQKGPIRVQNVSYTKPSANHLVVTFTVTNTGNNEELKQVDLANVSVAGSAIDFRFTSCPATDPGYVWSLLPGETSDIMTVDLFASTGGSQITYPCTFSDNQATASSTTSWPALSGTVTLTFKGLMSDASPWVAVGEGDER